MADTKTTALTEITAPVSTDLVYVVGDPGTTPVSRKATLATIRKTIMVDGWVEAGETWTYASADAPTFTFTISGDLTGKYSAGMRIKLTQTTVKYFIITAVSYGAPNTTVTIYGGTDYTLANAAITLPYYSMSKAPFGFPLDPAKWSVTVTDTTLRSQASPGGGTWYNLGSISISIPIGAWIVNYKVSPSSSKGGGAAHYVLTTLSTANNSESNSDFTCFSVGNSVVDFGASHSVTAALLLAAKTAYYLNTKEVSSGLTTLYNNNADAKLVISARCAYL